MNSVAAILQVKGSQWTKLCAGFLVLLGGLLLNQLPWHHSIGAWPDLLIPIVAFFVAATGIVWCLMGLARILAERKRVEHSLDTLGNPPSQPTARGTRYRRVFFPISILSVPLTILFGLFYLGMQFVQTGADRTGQCESLIQSAAETGIVPQSAALAGKPAVGCGSERYGMFLSLYNDVRVWGVANRSKQDEILQNLSGYQKQNHTLPMRVSFYE